MERSLLPSVVVPSRRWIVATEEGGYNGSLLTFKLFGSQYKAVPQNIVKRGKTQQEIFLTKGKG